MGKTGKGAITLLWAFGLLLLSNGKVSSEQEHGTRGPKGSLGLSSLRWRAAPEDKNRSRAAWRCCIRSRTKNPRKRSAMPRQEIPIAPWRIGGWQ